MMTKNLKNKVLLSVFAGAMVFSCAASAAEIEIDGTGLSDSPNEWAIDKGLNEFDIVVESGDKAYRLKDSANKLSLKKFNNRNFLVYNVCRVENSEYIDLVIGGTNDIDNDTALAVKNNEIIVSNSNIQNLFGASSGKYDVQNNKVYLLNKSYVSSVTGGYAEENKAVGNEVYIKNSEASNPMGAISKGNDVCDNKLILENAITNGIAVAGYAMRNDSNVYGNAIGNGIIIKNNTNVRLGVAAGYVNGGEAINNFITISGDNNLSQAAVAGWHGDAKAHSGNRLNIDDFTGKIKQVACFDIINFENLNLNKEKTLTIETVGEGLDKTKIDIISFAGGQNFEVGKTVELLIVENKDSWDKSFKNLNKQTTTNAGVAQVITSDIDKVDANRTITATIKGVKLADQTMLVAENRAVAAAFINQGTDLIADSLDTLSRDGKYGVKTFAAVHGNRSKYDVNSDLKINGWSTIVGVGAENEHNGGDFSWGVFYENGSGNYRTFNSFNNEFFRADGSLVYNGGGIAARYENAHGVYTEGSLRAGMLKSDMDNALSDGENKYGYSSESEYYGAHIGIGQIIPLTESSDLDVYGKFFHTYTEGDSFNVAGDEFEFDGINSDRLRVGARLTTNKENKFSTYYGLAYEYEFNGDAEMRAAGLSAPTQSLQGSSYMAEVGFNYQPTPDSPWSFDLNMRGYAGERDGATFNVQATYTF